jgi:hypothetical protein
MISSSHQDKTAVPAHQQARLTETFSELFNQLEIVKNSLNEIPENIDTGIMNSKSNEGGPENTQNLPPICVQCSKEISGGSVVEILEKFWHPNCFVCAGTWAFHI